MIKLYGLAGSRAFRPLWMLHELGLEFENVPTHFATGETRSAEFLKLNPNGHIPVLVDGQTVIWESLAINLYLARKYGGGRLWPASIEDEGRTFQWTLWAMTELEGLLIGVLMNRRVLPAEHRDETVAVASEAKLAGPFGVLEGTLRERAHLLGEAFSVADLNVASVMSWAVMSRLDLARWPQAADWLKRCLARPAAVKARA